MNKKIIIFSVLGVLFIIISVLTGGHPLSYENKETTPLKNQNSISKLILDDFPTSSHYSKLLACNHVGTASYNDDIIDEFTWSVLRYDHPCSSENFGTIGIPVPTQGIILLPNNMMSYETCYAASSIYQPDKMEILKALEAYDIGNMIHTYHAFFREKDEWNTPNIPTYRKENADEMKILGRLCLRADLVGDCYAQASFNTAVLRLCGFSPKEVFTAGITGHAVTVVKINDQWYVLDSTYAHYVRLGRLPGLLFTNYSGFNHLFFLENDKYFINFCHYSQIFPYLKNPYCNMDPLILTDIINGILTVFDNPKLGIRKWKITDFLEQALPCPDMSDIEFPYSIENISGNTTEEKADSLKSLNQAFVINQAKNEQIDQFDKSLYSLGFLSVDYPQAYANAAKYAAWTSHIACLLDTPTPALDYWLTSLWIRGNIFTCQTVPPGCVAFSDLPYLCRTGSTIDQAIMAYGTLRNMKKQDDFWPPNDLYIVITGNQNGYLAVNTTQGWRYLSFDGGKPVNHTPPNDIELSFNEKEVLNIWDQ